MLSVRRCAQSSTHLQRDSTTLTIALSLMWGSHAFFTWKRGLNPAAGFHSRLDRSLNSNQDLKMLSKQ